MGNLNCHRDYRPLGFCLLLFMQTQAGAIDIDPPAWRGSPGSTFQHWTFEFAQAAPGRRSSSPCTRFETRQTIPWGQSGIPEYINNPYQQTAGICVEYRSLWSFSRQVDWQETHLGRQGIWRLRRNRAFTNFLNFIVANAAIEKPLSATIQMQMVYYSISGLPLVDLQYQPLGKDTPVITVTPGYNYQNAELPEGWVHRTIRFELEQCPRFESIFIYPPEDRELFIDSVIIDTRCEQREAPTPGTGTGP